MNYTIFSIDDRRKHYTDAIRDQLERNFWWRYWPTQAVDGRDREELERNLETNHLEVVRPGMKVGQLGIWCTVVNALWSFGGKSLVTFEDDAILNSSFDSVFWNVTTNLPRDTDAFSLFLPRDQDGVYHTHQQELNVSAGICKAYQRYGGVSMLWTPRGADNFLKLVERDGITDQWDDQLYKYAQAGELNVYTQPPSPMVLVGISGTEESIVQESETL